MMIKNAPYKFSEFDSMAFQYGTGDSLLNKFNSKTRDYQYVDAHDSLVKTKLHLRNDDLLYLHPKAAELGFWTFPDNESNTADKEKSAKAPHYLMQFNYKQ